VFFSQKLLKQLGHPKGIFGYFVLKYLDKVNCNMNDLNYKCLNITKEDSFLEIGFGGGALIEKIDQENDYSLISGIEISKKSYDLA